MSARNPTVPSRMQPLKFIMSPTVGHRAQVDLISMESMSIQGYKYTENKFSTVRGQFEPHGDDLNKLHRGPIDDEVAAKPTYQIGAANQGLLDDAMTPDDEAIKKKVIV